MERDSFRKILNHMYEVQRIIYETKKCERTRCESCNYNVICAVLESLIKLLAYKVSDYDTKGELKP